VKIAVNKREWQQLAPCLYARQVEHGNVELASSPSGHALNSIVIERADVEEVREALKKLKG
jgi:hypothetical protein